MKRIYTLYVFTCKYLVFNNKKTYYVARNKPYQNPDIHFPCFPSVTPAKYRNIKLKHIFNPFLQHEKLRDIPTHIIVKYVTNMNFGNR